MTEPTAPSTAFEEVVDPGRLCFYCETPAVIEYQTYLTSEHPTHTLIEIAQGAKPTRGSIRIVADACAEHQDALWVALGEPPAAQGLTRSTCPDPWHYDDEAYEASTTSPIGVGDGWVGAGYECPTCKFATFSRFVIPEGVEHQPAYLFAEEAIQRGVRASS